MSLSLDEFGTIGLKQSGGRLNEEWHEDLQGSDAMLMYREMIDNSAVLGGWYTLFEFLIRQADLRVDAGAKTASAEAEAQKIRESLDDMDTPIETIIGEITSAGPFGFALWEKVFKLRRGPDETEETLRSKHTDGRIGWFDWAFRPQESLARWTFDSKSRWTHFVQSAPDSAQEITIPKEKLIHFVPRSWKRSPEGRSMIRSAVLAYRHAKGHAEREGIAGFKSAAGQFIIQTPMNTWDTSDAEEAVAARAVRTTAVKDLGKFSMTEYSAIATPPEEENGVKTGWKVWQAEGAKSLFPYDATIKRWESRMLIVVLCEHILLGVDKSGGSHALGDTKTDLFSLALGAILKRACVVLTKAAAELSRLNGVPPEDFAIVAHNDIETPDLTHMANFVGQILGVDPSQLNDIMRRHLENYARIPVGSLGTQEESVAAKPQPGPEVVPQEPMEEETDDASEEA